MIVNDLLAWKKFINERLENYNVILTPVTRSDNVSDNKSVAELKTKFLNNTNFCTKHLSKHNLHLNKHGSKRLAMNCIFYSKKL